MPVSKTVIPLDDEESIRRFTEQIKRRSTPSLPSLPSLQLQVEDLEGMITQPNSDSHVEHRATQTDPVMITQANGGSHTRNGFLAKPKSALDSVLLQSPPGSGVMAPPSTPENRPGLSNAEISQLIVNNIESLPATSTFTLGESRHAPRHYSTNKGHHPNVRGSSANDHVSSSMSVGQTSPADRNIRNQSFPRMSFQAADSPSNAVPKTSSPPVSPTDTMENASSWSVLEKSVSSSRWASPQANPPATEPRNARPTPVPWESVGKYTEMNEKPEKGSLDSGIGSISRGTAELAVSVNEQVDSLIEGDTAKPTKPKDNWLPPHLRTPDYAFKDPRVVKPNRSYLTRNKPSAEVPKENKKPPTDDLVTSPVAEITTTPAPAQVVAMPDDPVLSKSILREVSPPTATEDTKENREGQLYFSAWGKPEERFKAAAKVRKAVIKFPNSTPSPVTSLVWGGIVEEINIKPSSAEVLFAYAEDCQNYCDATAKGIKFKKDGRDIVAFVDKGKDVDVVSGKLTTFLELGFTRCVRAVDVLEKFTPNELRMKAEYRNRKIESIDIGMTETKPPLRFVVFRFCSISNAVEFKQALQRDEEWEHCNVHYVADPCAQATGVHVE